MSLLGVTLRRVTYQLLVNDPVSVWHVEEGHRPEFSDKPIMAIRRALEPVNGRKWVTYRGVPIDCFNAVVSNGVDTSPPDSPIFCAEEDKAYEYARPRSGCDGPGLMYALHGGYLERSFRTLPADAPAEQIAEVRMTYPHQYDNPNGGLYFSRLAGQTNIAYEMSYGYWIPGNARDALLAIFLVGQMDAITEVLRDSLEYPSK